MEHPSENTQTHHSHHEHSNEHKKKKRMSKGTRVLLRVVIVIVVIALILAATVLILDHMGKGNLTGGGDMSAIPEAEIESAGRVRYKGQLYQYKKNITSILLMGVDARTKEDATGEFDCANQSDVNVLAVLDPNTKEITLINVSRDAMVEMEVLDPYGNSKGTAKAQLALAYSYGDGANLSCELTRDAVSGLFYDLPIHAYASIYMNGIADLVGEVGGVTVTALETFGDFTQGQQVQLTRSNTENYIRYRAHDTEGNNQRMERQKQVLIAMTKAMLSSVRKQPISILTIYDAVKRNVTTDLNTSSILYLGRTAAGMQLNEEMRKVVGESVLGAESHAEYLVDETALYELILSVFYEPIDG